MSLHCISKQVNLQVHHRVTTGLRVVPAHSSRHHLRHRHLGQVEGDLPRGRRVGFARARVPCGGTRADRRARRAHRRSFVDEASPCAVVAGTRSKHWTRTKTGGFGEVETNISGAQNVTPVLIGKNAILGWVAQNRGHSGYRYWWRIQHLRILHAFFLCWWMTRHPRNAPWTWVKADTFKKSKKHLVCKL